MFLDCLKCSATTKTVHTAFARPCLFGPCLVSPDIWEFPVGFRISMCRHRVRPSDSIRKASGTALSCRCQTECFAVWMIAQIKLWACIVLQGSEPPARCLLVWLAVHERKRGQCARSEEKGTAQPSSKITQGIRWCDFWELELNGSYHLICFHMQGKHSYAICSLMLHNMRFTRQLCSFFCCSAGSQWARISEVFFHTETLGESI